MYNVGNIAQLKYSGTEVGSKNLKEPNRFWEVKMETLYWVEAREQKKISMIVHTPEETTDQNAVLTYFHGFTGNKIGDNRMGIKLARALCKQGYTVVRFDYIGSGESEGEFEKDTYFSGWVEDAKVVLNWVREHFANFQLGIIGHSLGGSLALYISSVDQGIKAACALAPAFHLEKVFQGQIIGPEK